MWLVRARVLVAALWAGSLWTVGYLVAPILSATLSDRAQFGNIAAGIFRGEAWLSVACALVMLGLLARSGTIGAQRRRGLVVLVLAMLACTLIGYFGLQPVMAALRESAGPAGVMESGMRTQFAVLHGVAAVFYLIQSVLGVFLVLRNPGNP
jgi:hypothetical protein